MQLITKTYTIQWVGPMDYDQFKEYCSNPETLDPSYFNLYYFEARQDSRCKLHKYIGIHKENDGIDKRIGIVHHKLGSFIKNQAKDIKIWIGSMARKKDQKESIIDKIETLLIRAYRLQLDMNDRKKKTILIEPICVVNQFYNIDEQPEKLLSNRPKVLEDVVMYDSDLDSFLHGNLRKVKNVHND